MPLDKEAVLNVFHLSRITPGPGEVETFSSQLDAVLTYMEKLNSVNTDHVDPVRTITDLSNVFRKDQVKESIDTADALKNAPQHDETFFRVPKVF